MRASDDVKLLALSESCIDPIHLLTARKQSRDADGASLAVQVQAGGSQEMIIGAVIAGLVIVSLLLETISSSPKSDKPAHTDTKQVP